MNHKYSTAFLIFFLFLGVFAIVSSTDGNITGTGLNQTLALWDSSTSITNSTITFDGSNGYNTNGYPVYGTEGHFTNSVYTGYFLITSNIISSIVSPMKIDSSDGWIMLQSNNVPMLNVSLTTAKYTSTSSVSGYVSDNTATGGDPYYSLTLDGSLVSKLCVDDASNDETRLTWKEDCSQKYSWFILYPANVASHNAVFELSQQANIEFWGARESFTYAGKISSSSYLSQDGQPHTSTFANDMPYTGSIKSISYSTAISSLTVAGNFTVQVYKNGAYLTGATSLPINVTTNSSYRNSSVFDRNTYVFSNNDLITCFFNKISGTYTATITCSVEVQYDQ